MNNYKKLMLLAMLAGGLMIKGREVRTPDPLRYGPMHYPSGDFRDSGDWCFDWDVWGGAWGRSADSSFCQKDSTKHPLPWSNVLFGSSDFTFAAVFPGGAATTEAEIIDNPFVSVVNLSPRYDYSEKGFIAGVTVGTRFGDGKWKLQLRVRLPFRDIRVSPANGGPFGQNNLQGEAVDELYKKRNESIVEEDGKTYNNTVFAARLDFLSALRITALTSAGNPGSRLVNYADPNNIINGTPDISIASVNATGAQAESATLATNQPPVAVIKTDNTAMPEGERWGDNNLKIKAVVQAEGSGLTNDQRGRFASDINYTPLGTNTANQKTLWVVPTINDSGAAVGQITSGATQIMNAIDSAVEGAQNTVTDYIEETGLDFFEGSTSGLGNLDTELGLGRNFCDDRLTNEVTFAVRWPTDTRLCDCKKVILLPRGNNGHYEIRLGKKVGWHARDWLKLKMDLYYSFVLRRTENIAAPFATQAIANIGPCVPAGVKWGYFEGYFGANFNASEGCGFYLGYDLYVKQHDKFTLYQTTAADLAGVEHPLDASSSSAIVKNTQRVSHKSRVEFYMSTSYCELTAGWTHVFAGKNIGRDTDWYLSMAVSF